MNDAVSRCECGQTHAWCKANECPELPLPAAATIESLQAKVAELEGQNEHLQKICAAAYQMAGSAGAPVRFLNALSSPLEVTSEQVDALLPIAMHEFAAL